MSRQVDERVVSMQFDNRNFETNVKTTMSTLDKLKEKLNFNGATKGLENVSSAAKNVDMSGLGNAVETVKNRFSMLDIVGVTALVNIANSAVNAGKNLLKSLTITPITTGFDEYELKMNSIRVIMSSTGEELQTVNKYLDELNEYSDRTIYSFADMTQNIGKFTNAGVKLDDAVLAIKGISNEAAVSGANTNEASRAMYNFAQALSAGYVKLIDWKSIENANMATKEFKEQLIQTAVELGTVTKAGDGMYKTLTGKSFNATKNFNDVLQEQWMTSEVLIETLKDYSDESTTIGKKAYAAAEDVTKFTQMLDVLKETAQSGWAQTWEIIFGDMEQAKALFTPLTKFFSGIIDAASTARNILLKGALQNPFTAILDKLDSGKLKTLDTYKKKIETTAGSLEHYQKVVTKVWRGDFKNAPVRYDLLTKAGYDDPKVIQELVNKGYGYKLTVEDITEAQKKHGKVTKEVKETTDEMSVSLDKLSDKQLENAGLTDEEIKLYRQLEAESKRTGKTMQEIVSEMEKTDGRTLLIESFKNAGQGLVAIFTSIKEAWVDIFPPMTVFQLYNIIKAINSFSQHLKVGDETADNLKRTLKGLFAILDIVLTVVGGPLKIAFKALTQLLGMFDLDILDVTAKIGDAIVSFRDWIDSTLDFTKIFEKLIPAFKDAGKAIGEWIDKLKESDNIPRDIILGLVNGLVGGVKLVAKAVYDIAKAIVQTICDYLGIHSPSTVFEGIGKNTILGFINGIQNGASGLWDIIKNLGSKLIDLVKKIDFGSIIAAGFGIGIIYMGKKVVEVLDKFAAPLQGIGDMFSGVGSFFKDFGQGLEKYFKAKAWESKSKAIRNLALSIGILAGSIYLLAQLKPAELWQAVGAIAALAGVLVLLSLAMSQMSKIGDYKVQAASIVGMAVSLIIVAGALKILSGIDGEDVPKTLSLLAGMIIGIGLLAAAFSLFTKKGGGKDVSKAGGMLLKMAAALLIMTIVIKSMSKLEGSAIIKGLAVIAAVELLFMAIIAVSKLAGENASKAGTMLLKMSLAFLVMTYVIKQIAGLDGSAIIKGLGVISLLSVFFAAFIAISALAGPNARKAGSMLLLMSGAFLIMTIVINQIAKMSDADIDRGIGVITTVGLIFAALIAVTKIAGKYAVRAGAMLILMSGALLILTSVLFIIANMDPVDTKRALSIVTTLEILMGGLIFITKYSKDCSKTIMQFTIAIGLLIVALVALSFVDPKKLAMSTAALTSVISALALLVAATGSIKDAGKMNKPLFELMGAVVIMAALIFALAQLDPGRALAASGSLSILLIALAASFALLGKTGRISATVKKNLAPMMAVVAGLMAILVLMTSSGIDPLSALGNAVALSVVLEAFAAAMVILGQTGRISATVKPLLPIMMAAVAEIGLVLGLLSKFDANASIESAVAIGVVLEALATSLVILQFSKGMNKGLLKKVEIMALVLLEIGVVFGLLKAFDIQPSIESAVSLSTLLLAMSAACFIVSHIKASAAVEGAAGLAAFIAIMAVVLAALGGLSKIPGFNELIADGGKTLAAIGYAIGEFVGSIVGGFASGATSGLPDVGTHLSDFITNLAPFLEGIKGIDSSVADGIKSLTLAILGLTAAEFLDSISSFISEGASLGQLGSELSDFMTNLAPFLSGISGITPETIDAAASLAKLLLALTAAELLDGINNIIGFGSQGLDTFADTLVPFGEAMVAFSDTVAGNIDPAAVECAANAGKIMAGLANSLPRDKGTVFGFFDGKEDLNEFGAQLVPFGRAMVRFSSVVDGNINTEAVECAANAGKIMASLANSLPRDKSTVFGFFDGKEDLNAFGAQLVPYGRAMVRFSSVVDGNISTTAVQCAADAGHIMASLAKSLPRDPETVFGFFTHTTELDQFGAQIVPFGRALVRFSNTVDGNIESSSVQAAADAGTVLANLANSLPRDKSTVFGFFDGKTDMGTFGEQIAKFGDAMVDFSKSVSGGIDEAAMTATVTAAMNVATTASKFTNNDLKMDGLSENLTALADAMIDFSSKISGNVDLTAIRIVVDAGKTLAEASEIMPAGADLSKITVGLASFGQSMIDFSNLVKDQLDPEQIKSAVQTGKDIAGMLSELPTDLNLVAFSIGLSLLGTSLVSFSNSVSEGIDTYAINMACEAGKTITGFIETIPDYIDVTDFVYNAGSLGRAIVNFSNSVKEGVDSGAIGKATAAGRKITGFIETIPDYIDVTDFVLNAYKLGNSIVRFSKSVKEGVDAGAIEKATKSGKKITSFIETIPDYIDMTDFSSNVSALGRSIVNFSKNVKEGVDITAVGNATSAGRQITGFVKTIPDYLNVTSFTIGLPSISKAIKNFADDMDGVSMPDIGKITSQFKKLGNAGVDGFTKAFKDSTSKANTAGKNLVNNVANAISNNKNRLSNAAKSMASGAVTAIREQFLPFFNAGMYLVKGFALGITANTFLAAARAAAMADAAVRAAKKELDEHSPSKVGYHIGDFFGIGFVNGIRDNVGLSGDAGTEIANSARSGLSDAISRIKDVIGSDLDVQPTISPVLDLTNVRSGARTMGSLLNTNPSVGVLSNVGAINSRMNQRIQNGINDDVVSAIGKLRDDISNMQSNVYNLNGITYDDGSNISEAVKTIVRAAIIERRT